MEQNNNEISGRNVSNRNDAGGKKVVIETYAEDMAKAIENDKGGGLVKKLIHGEEEYQKEKIKGSPESKKNKFFLVGSLFLIILAFIILSFFPHTKGNQSVPVEKQFVPIIFNDASVFKEIAGFDREGVTQTVLNEVSAMEVKEGGVGGIYLTNNKNVIGLRELVSLLKLQFAPDPNPVLVYDNFLLGVVNGDTRDFFIILKMRSLADIFDSLRAWEPKMFTDLSGFFGIEMNPDNKYLFTKEFENGVVENKNARILYDNENNIVMMYILADDNSVVITDTDQAAHEVMLRLASSQLKK